VLIIPGVSLILLVEKEIISPALFSANGDDIFLGLLLVDYSALLFLGNAEVSSSDMNKLLLILSKF
jgi:hypothetical protein